MNIEYCDKCSVRIDGEVVVGPSGIGHFCKKCASEIPGLIQSVSHPVPARKSSRRLPAVRKTPVGTPHATTKTPASGSQTTQAVTGAPPPAFSHTTGNMAFYFCESCGRRLTTADLEQGRARDKQIKGIYCMDCARGVNTVTFDAISMKDAMAIRRENNLPDVPMTAGAIAASANARTRKTHQNEPGAAKTNWALVAGAAAVVMVVFTVIMFRGSANRSAPVVASFNTAAPKKTVIADAPPPPAVVMPETIAPPQPERTPPAAPRTEDPAAQYVARAATMLSDSMKWFAENPNEMQAYHSRLEAVAREFPSSPAAKQARDLMEKLRPAVEARLEPRPEAQPEAARVVATAQPAESNMNTPQNGKGKPAINKPAQRQAQPTPVDVPKTTWNQPLATASQRTVVGAYDKFLDCLSAPASSQLSKMNEATAISASMKQPEFDGLNAIMQRGTELYKHALTHLAANVPAEEIPIQNKKLLMKGKVLRIEGEKAWVRAQGLEMPVTITSLPEDILFRSMGLGSGGRKISDDRFCYLFASGNVDAALAQARSDSHPWLAQHAKVNELKRLCRFEDLEQQIEVAIGASDLKQGEKLLDTMKKSLAEEVNANAERVLLLQQRLRMSAGAPPLDPNSKSDTLTGTLRPGLWLGYWEKESDRVWYKTYVTGMVDSNLCKNWGNGAPAEGVPFDFAARWQGMILIPSENTWQFKLEMDDELRLFIDKKEIIPDEVCTLQQGFHDIRIEFLDRIGGARASIKWKALGKADFEPIPEALLWHDVRFLESYKKN